MPKPGKRWLAGVLGLVFVTACTSIEDGGGAPSANAARTDGGSIVYGTSDEPTGFNYASSEDSALGVRDVIENIHYFAAKARPDGTLVYPGLKDEPTVVSESPQVIEWTIAEDSTWSDGTPVTTQDIQNFFAYVTDPEADIASRVGYEQIQELEVADDKTFRATFSEPYSDFRGLWQAIPQAAFVNDNGGWEESLNDEPGPSAGPYVFETWERGSSLTLVPNPEYSAETKPTLDTLVFRFLPDTTTIPDALRNGEIDVIQAQAQVDLLQDLENIPTIESEVVVGPSFEHLVINVQDPVTGQPAVREAIALGIDRGAIVDALVKPLAPEAVPLDNMVLPDPQRKDWEGHADQFGTRDVDAAKATLEEAGWTAGDAGTYEKDGSPLVIDLATTAGNERREQAVELIKNQLAEVGIEAQINNCPSDCLFSDRLPAGDFQVALKSWSGSPFPIADALARFGSSGGDNYSAYESEEWDALGRQATSALDPTEQTRIANEMDAVLWRDLPMIPLFQRPDLAAYEASITGIEPNGTRDGILWNAAAWGRTD